jgi:hypothetical protein
MTAQLTMNPVISAHITAINSFDVDAIMDTFADDALVNDFSREFWGTDHIRAVMTKEFLPDPLIMTNYFRVINGKIVSLFVVKNTEPQY